MTMRTMTDAGMDVTVKPELTLPVNSKRDHCLGPDDAPVTLLEYGDYECPFCGRAYVIIKRLQEYFGDSSVLLIAISSYPEYIPMPSRAAESAEGGRGARYVLGNA